MTRSKLGRLLVALTATAVAGAAHAVTVMRGPYFQMSTPSSMIVRWRTDTTTDSVVQYGAAPGSLTQVQDDTTATTEHLVALTGLGADTQYYYAVGSAGGALVGDDADHVFRTAPVPGTRRPTRIWATGDGGFVNAGSMAVRDAFATYTAGTETHLFLLLGDNAYLTGTDAQYQAALFDLHHDLLVKVPVWSTFGNHEAISSDSLTQTGPYFDMFSFPTAGEAGGAASGTEAYYSFDHANIHFIVLDSEQSPAAAGTPMLLWLEADLQATTADWVIAVWHRPPYSSGALHNSDTEGAEIDMRQFVLPLLETYGVDLVLNGHSHSYERSHVIDNHYGLSSTLTSAMVRDAGDGNPSSDGAYRKPTLAQTPHSGAVFVVAGSSSEVRSATLNHPVMEIGLLELGSFVLDVDGNTATGTFLNSAGATTDTFTIVKGCPLAPQPGCTTSARGRLVVRNNPNDALDKVTWRWMSGTVNPGDVGTPTARTDFAFCVYDPAGRLVGGAVPHGGDSAGAGLWKVPNGGGFRYLDAGARRAGVEEIKIKPVAGTKTPIKAKGRGAALGVPALPATLPLRAQLVNLDSGVCWETVFPTAKKNDATRVLAAVP